MCQLGTNTFLRVFRLAPATPLFPLPRVQTVRTQVPTMPVINLTAEQTNKLFGVGKAINNFPAALTTQEVANVKVVLEYMEVRSVRSLRAIPQ